MTDLPRCENCSSLLAPGAPFCMTCWLPIGDPEPAEPVEPATAEEPVPVVPDTVPAEWSAAPVAAPPAGGFYAAAAPPPAPAPDPFAPPGAAPPGWRPPAVPGATVPYVQQQSSGRGVNVIVLCVVGVLVLLAGSGLWFGYQALKGGGEKAKAAKQFSQSGGFLGDFMVGGSREAAMAASPADKAMAAAWLQSVEPMIADLNAAIGEMQSALDQWAGGDLDNGGAARAVLAFKTKAEAFVDGFDASGAPEFLVEDAANLTKGAIQYVLSVDGMLSLIDGRKGLQRMSFGLSAASANTAWDAGIETLYGVAGKAPLYRPNRKAP